MEPRILYALASQWNFHILISCIIRRISVQQNSILILMDIKIGSLTISYTRLFYAEKSRYLKHVHHDYHLPKIQIH